MGRDWIIIYPGVGIHVTTYRFLPEYLRQPVLGIVASPLAGSAALPPSEPVTAAETSRSH